MFPPALHRAVEEAGIIAVLVIDREEDAAPLAETLFTAGIRLVEVTLRTPAALRALKVMVREVPEMLCGAGTVLNPEQVAAARAAGAAFGVAPGVNPAVLEAARNEGLPFAPGVLTPSEIEVAVGWGCRLLKFFPAQAFGGAAALHAVSAPYRHLGLKYIPLGGLKPETASEYLSLPDVAALGGSWIAPPELVRNRDWPLIAARAGEALQMIATYRTP